MTAMIEHSRTAHRGIAAVKSPDRRRVAWHLLIVALVVAWHPSDGRAATGLVQSAHRSNFASGATSSIQFTTNVTAGNLVAVYIAWTNATDTLAGVTDSLGNTYTLVQNSTTLGDYGRAAGAYAKNIIGGSCTITVTFSSGAFAARTIIAREISGADTTSPLDGSAAHAQMDPGTGIDAVTSGSITTTASGSYIFAATSDLGQRATVNPGTGFTAREAVTAPVGGRGADYIQATAGPIAATFTNTDATFADFLTLVMAFKPMATPDTTPPTITVTAPTDGSTVSGTITVAAAAFDDLRVAGVQFRLDDEVLGLESFSSAYATSWNSAFVSNGPHTLTAVVRDAAGNTAISAPVTVNVANVGASQGIIGPDRRTEWSRAGVPGGIPHRTSICASLSPGVTHTEINTAIANCDDGVVYLGPGTYNLSGGITFGGRSNVTLRGAGADQTIVVFGGADFCGGLPAAVCVHGTSRVWPGSVPPSQIRAWTAGYGRWTTHISLESTAGIEAGMILILDQLDDTADLAGVLVSDAPTFSVEGGAPGRPDRSQQQFVQVVAVNGNEVAISPGLHMPNWRASQQPQAWWWGNSSVTAIMNGVEDLTLDHSQGTETAGVVFGNAHAGWVRNVKSLNARRAHVGLYQAARIEVRDGYFYGTKNSVSQSYGVESFTTSDSLVVNNIFQHVTSPLMTGVSAGSVFAYNYMVDMHYSISTWMMAGIVGAHGSGSGMNLFEGNVANQLLMDTYHGAGALVTLFRNLLAGTEPDKRQGNTTPVSIWAYNRSVNIVGNVLGTPGYHFVYETSSSGASGSPEGSIYVLGYSGVGQNLFGDIPYDPRVGSSLLRWGNYDYATNRAHWEASEIPTGAELPSDHLLPPSLFLSSRPVWWGTSPWPATGPDVAGGGDPSGHVHKIPAQACYESTPKDVQGILLFNAAPCYGPPQ